MNTGRLREILSRPVRFGGSLHLRLFIPLAAAAVGALVVLTLFSLDRFEEASTFQLRHEAIVLSDALEAAVAPYLGDSPDIPAIQGLVDRLVAARERNDIEINVMLLEGNRSVIVASNIPDNIENTDIYEHRALVAALEEGKPSFFVGEDVNDPFEPVQPPSHPDHYVGPGNRFISVTSPLYAGGKGVGAVNTKLSLVEIDKQIGAIRKGLVAAVIGVPLVALLVIHLIVRRGLVPLNRIGRKTEELGVESLGYRFTVEDLPRELCPICVRLNDLFGRLEAAFERERRFSANVAHELRTPIAELRTLCEVRLEYGPWEDGERDTRRVVQQVLEITTQMERLITALTDLVRTECGQTKVETTRVDLADLIRKSWQAFEEPSQERSLACCLDLPEKAPVETDRNLMSAVLSNLFSNAVAYTPPDGDVRCVLRNRDGVFRLDVENSVMGIAASDLHHMSEPFWRGDAARTDGEHSGLGLALASAYASLLGFEFKIDLPTRNLFRVRIESRPDSSMTMQSKS